MLSSILLFKMLPLRFWFVLLSIPRASAAECRTLHRRDCSSGGRSLNRTCTWDEQLDICRSACDLLSEDACLIASDCNWYSSRGECVNIASCQDFNDPYSVGTNSAYKACKAASHCDVVSGRTGQPVGFNHGGHCRDTKACDELASELDCILAGHCSWQSGECELKSCDAVRNSHPCEKNGCLWEQDSKINNLSFGTCRENTRRLFLILLVIVEWLVAITCSVVAFLWRKTLAAVFSQDENEACSWFVCFLHVLAMVSPYGALILLYRFTDLMDGGTYVFGLLLLVPLVCAQCFTFGFNVIQSCSDSDSSKVLAGPADLQGSA